jgi:hypothetical protein
VKCSGLAQEIDFSAANLCTLPWPVKDTTQLFSYQKEYNKLNLIAVQYF